MFTFNFLFCRYAAFWTWGEAASEAGVGRGEALGEAERLYRRGLSMHPACGRATRYSNYLLYWYKSTNTDARKLRPAIWLPSSTSRSLSPHTPIYVSSYSGT